MCFPRHVVKMRCNSPSLIKKKRQDNVRCMVQLRGEGEQHQHCLLVPFTSAPITWQNCNQVLPDTGHADPLAFRDKKNIRRSPRQMISHKKYDFQLTLMKIYHSTKLLLGHSTSAKCLHYHKTTLCIDWRILRRLLSVLLSP